MGDETRGKRKTVRLLLINPRFPESFWSFRWAIREILSHKRAINPPLGLATLAALCPPHWHVELVDENVETIPLAPAVDIVGVCGMGVQHARQRELLEFYRAKGCHVVAGGSWASLCPDAHTGVADTIVAGEAEYIWKAFCSDFEQCQAKALYKETGAVSLADSPTPRFDLLKLDRYTTATLQFSRGCPYLCEFCDIIVMFGRRPRCKSPQQIGRELDALRERGVRSVFFVDDNLIGNCKAAKALLKYLKDYQIAHSYPFSFGTEASINLSQDAELLTLFRDARFAWVFIGIESPDEASLAEAGKTQNLREDLRASVRRIYAHGIDVLAGFIVGFDNDTVETFDRQFRFIMETGIQAAMVGLLTALPRTPLHRRLAAEGRLLDPIGVGDNTKLVTNILPKRMTYSEMIGRYADLYRRLLDDRAIATRVRNKLALLREPVYQGEYGHGERWSILRRFLTKGLLAGGPRRIFHVVRSLPLHRPRQLPLAILDWITALAMKDYVARHFEPPRAHEHRIAAGLVADLERTLGQFAVDGVALLQLRGDRPPEARLSLTFAGWVDPAFLARTGRQLARLLRRTSVTLTLHIHAARQSDALHLDRLLARLVRYGDRVRIVADEGVHALLRIDSSVFRVLAGPTRA